MNVDIEKGARARLDFVDFLRGIFMLVVVWNHSSAYISGVGLYTSLFMPIYFFLAGYITKNKSEPFLAICGKKAKRLLIPYALYGTVSVAVYFIMDLIVKAELSQSMFNMIGLLYGRYMLYDTVSVHDPSNIYFMKAYNSTLWFLLAMFICFVLFYIWLKANNKALKILLFASYIISSIVMDFLPILLPWSLDTVGILTAFMICGYLFKEIKNNIRWHTLIVFTAFYLALSKITGAVNISVGKYGHRGVLSIICYLILSIVGSIVCICIAEKLLSFKTVKNCFAVKYFSWVGKRSMTFMCIQLPVIALINFIFSLFSDSKYFIGFAEIVFTFVICSISTILFDKAKGKFTVFKYL